MSNAIDCLMDELNSSDAPLDGDTINLLGIDGTYSSIERNLLRDIGLVFRDLMNGRIDRTSRSTEIMPGTIPYNPKKDT